MESISLFDGFILTIVSMILVFLVLGAIGVLTDVIAKFVNEEESTVEKASIQQAERKKRTYTKESLKADNENQFVAEMMALVLASEDEPNRKFEVVESKRIK